MKTKINKFIVMLAILLGSASTEIKAQNYSGHPIIPRKANGQDYTKAEIKAKLSQSGVYWDAVRSEIVRLTNIGLEKSGEAMRVTAKNIGWIIDSSVYLPKNEYGDQIKNGYTIDYKTIKYVTTRKTEGNYLVFQYRKCSVRILDPACLNPQEEIVTQNISEAPNVQQDFASDYNAQNETKTKVQETETVVEEEEECWIVTKRRETYYVNVSTPAKTVYAGVGDFSGSYGNRIAVSSGTSRVKRTRTVRDSVRCEDYSPDEETFDDEEETEVVVVDNNHKTFVINGTIVIGGISFSRGSNGRLVRNTGGGTVQQTGKPSFPTTKGKPSFPTTKGKPSFPTTRRR
ncbi:MAG: hypothetical protein QG566_310 [Patescibacteria group bacterium]|nr:hypothetical protein [Patescibacteria group bacterium]